MRRMELDKIMDECIGHRVTVMYCSLGESQLREITGVLIGVSKEVIHIRIYDIAGRKEDHYMNRHSSTIHSIVDEGKVK